MRLGESNKKCFQIQTIQKQNQKTKIVRLKKNIVI